MYNKGLKYVCCLTQGHPSSQAGQVFAGPKKLVPTMHAVSIRHVFMCGLTTIKLHAYGPVTVGLKVGIIIAA